MAKPTETNLFQRGEFVLNSGARSGWKLECDALTDDDWEALAYMIWQVVGPFHSVEGVPRGGLKLAERLEQYRSPTGPYLLVDDVLTTGGSMGRVRQAVYQRHLISERDRPSFVQGAVVFARGKCPAWVTPLFQMPEVLWLPKAGD